MRNTLILLITLLIICLYANGQDTTQFMRAPYKLNIAVNKNYAYVEEIRASPYVLPDKTIQLYPGEIIFIEVEQENGIIKRMTAVNAIKASSKTLTVRFSQTAKKKVHELMMLQVTNPFPYILIYKARIFLFPQQQWISTDVYPVKAGLSGFETWPNIIISIALNEWKLQAG